MKKIAAVILFLSALSLRAQDSPHRLVEAGVDFGAPFSGFGSYLGTAGILKEDATLDWSDMVFNLDNRLRAFFDVHESAYLNFNLGVNFKLGFFAGVDSFGQFQMPSSAGLDRGAASFMEAGLWFSTRIKRWTFTVRPSYFLPLVYVKDTEIYTPLPLAHPGDTNLMDVFKKGGLDLALRGTYPLFRNFLIGGAITHIPLFSAVLTDAYSITGDAAEGVSVAGNKAIYRPFKLGIDAVYRPFYKRIFAIKPELALAFNTIYDTPVSVYADFALTGELNLKDILIVDAGTHFEDLMWKQRVDLLLNFRVLEFTIGIGTKSPQFIETFQGAGFGVDFGIRVGY
ncbi:hypothetical protein AGMMS4952_23860 [Spirochaetia bacterium]|nr:hypothetical protein AGMMS4952_23860 [Spirochaetia bacterium]